MLSTVSGIEKGVIKDFSNNSFSYEKSGTMETMGTAINDLQAHLVLSYFSDTAFFYILKVCGNPGMNKSIGTIFSNGICSFHVSVS